MLEIQRANTILYCSRFAATVAFYRDVFGLTVAFENDWFVEFGLADGAFLSVADVERSTIRPAHGDGITLSWEVADVVASRESLDAAGVAVSAVSTRWGAAVVDVFDPEGHRIELWSA